MVEQNPIPVEIVKSNGYLRGFIDCDTQMTLVISTEGLQVLQDTRELRGWVDSNVILMEARVVLSVKDVDYSEARKKMAYSDRADELVAYELIVNEEQFKILREDGFTRVEGWEFRRVTIYTEEYCRDQGYLR